jgi:hypothetical protein
MVPNLVPFVHDQFNQVPATTSAEQGPVASGRSGKPSSSSTDTIDVAAIDVDRQLPILPMTIGIGTLQNVLLDGGSGVNMITEEERLRLGLPASQAAPYRLRMADQTVVEPVGLIRNIKIHIHGIPYFISLTVICNTKVNDAYSMLLGRP